MSIVIETVSRATDELVAALARLAPQLGPTIPAPSRDALAEIVASPGSVLFVARLDEASPIAGTLTLALYRTPSGLHAWIEDVVVDDAARGRGIGEALVRAALDSAASRGAAGVSLTSRPGREAANRLYRRLGFDLRETNVYHYPLP